MPAGGKPGPASAEPSTSDSSASNTAAPKVELDPETGEQTLRRGDSTYGPGGSPYGRPGGGYGRPSTGSPYGSGGYYGPPRGRSGYGTDYGSPGGYPLSAAAKFPGGLRLAAVERSKSLVARGPKDAVDKVADIVQAFDVPEGHPIGKLERFGNLRVLNFEHGSASELAQLIEQIGLAVQVLEARDRAPAQSAGPAGTLTEAATGGTLILAGSADELAQAEELIKSLDAEAEQETPLKSAPATP
jgi:type II secretory pathway component GspD/PulD (secretin)